MGSMLKLGTFLGVSLVLLMGCSSVEDNAAHEAQASSVWPETKSPVVDTADTAQRVEAILSRMTIEEKVGQILQAEIQAITPEDAKAYHIGSILNGGGSLPGRKKHATPEDWVALADAFYDATMDSSDGGTSIPIIWGTDAVHGHNNVVGATLFPHNIGLGATHNPELIKKIGAATAKEVRVTGIDWTFAPTLAVARNDRWGRTYESYSEDPDLVKVYATAMVEGLQGTVGDQSFLGNEQVVATAKHFVGDGATEAGDDQGNAKITEAELAEIHGAGYGPAIEAGVQSIMASFSSWNGSKMHGSKYLLTDILKGRMGFDGLVVGDWNGHGQLPGCTNASCADAINAGVDLVMVPTDWKAMFENTLAQVQAGDITMERLDDAVRRVLLVKMRAGLFDAGKPSVRGIAGKAGVIGSAEHRAIAREAVRESLVLLKNKGHVLPINPKATILVAGDGADNIGKQAGGWSVSWQGTGNTNEDFPGGSSIYEGIRMAVERAGGSAVLSVDGSYEARPDVAVVVFGENPYAEGLGDIDTLEFEPGNKESLSLLQGFQEAGIPTVSVFLSGRPLWVNPELNASDAFVAAWLPGSEGAGVADVLLGNVAGDARYDFKGKLSFSWPKLPLQDVLNVGDANYDPLFAYGYGLTYASGEEGPDHLPEDVPGRAQAELSELALYEGRPLSPWYVTIGDASTSQILSGASATLTTGTVSVVTSDKDIQEDALTVTFLSSGKVSIENGPALNLTDFQNSDGLMVFDMKVDSAPSKASLAIECSENCASVPMESIMKEKAGAGWQQYSIRLACFAPSGQSLESVQVPFRLYVADKSVVSLSGIRIVKGGDASVSCPAS